MKSLAAILGSVFGAGILLTCLSVPTGDMAGSLPEIECLFTLMNNYTSEAGCQTGVVGQFDDVYLSSPYARSITWRQAFRAKTARVDRRPPVHRPLNHQRYPGRGEPMTIGVGVLCCSSEHLVAGERPDTIAMMADTMGSTEEDSTNELRKLHVIPEEKVYSVCAGNVETASQIVGATVERIPQLARRTHGALWFLLNTVVNGHRAERFRWDVAGPRYELSPGKIAPEDHANIIQEFQNYDVGAELMFGTFDENGMALMYYVGRLHGTSALVHPILTPGYQAVGAGYHNAMMWMNYRGQRLNFSMRRSVLHAYEAVKMAGSTPTVNDNIDVVVATARETFALPYDSPPTSNSPLALEDLEKMAKRFGPRRTDSLGFQESKASKAVMSQT